MNALTLSKLDRLHDDVDRLQKAILYGGSDPEKSFYWLENTSGTAVISRQQLDELFTHFLVLLKVLQEDGSR